MPLVEVQVLPETLSARERSDSVITLRPKAKDRANQRDHAEPDQHFFGRHRWNPDVSWTAQEEAKVVRKTDCFLLLVVSLMMLVIHIDRFNLYNALTDNFLGDAGLDTRDFDNAVMITRSAVLLSEFPVQILVLRYGFKTVFPPLIMSFGVVSACQCLVHGRAAFFIVRGLLGLLEGGYMPGMVHFFTQFYTTSEMAPRLAVLAAMTDLGHIIASLMAALILKMRGVAGQPGWFWLFLIEGSITLLIGVLSLLYLPWCVTDTQSLICRSPWYSDREETIMVNRLLRDDPAKGQSALKIRPSLAEVRDTLIDKKQWILYTCSFLGLISYLPVRQYLGLTLRRLHFSVFNSNMLQVPPALIQMVTVLLLAWSSEYFKERTWHCTLAHLFPIPFLIALETVPEHIGMWERYGLTASIVASPSYYPVLIAWTCEATFSVKKRAIAVTILNVLTLAGAIVASQVYQKDDEPYYYNGNKFLIAVALLACLLFVINKMIMNRVNSKRDKQWEQMTTSEQMAYQIDTEHEEFHGNRRIDFRFPT
ncbi:major facilitator superfamily domain-containing protein [Elsinoe ampelina]|uniref:Major facilitator superfamily domain-containing protein n=1 Tax=Elsinoe ampelina TaxID=302913 RepID=A0A6A6G2K9_9PEZI|nr:major facilitator superfamily domain-containing protein [Elsinoe ampelina]